MASILSASEPNREFMEASYANVSTVFRFMLQRLPGDRAVSNSILDPKKNLIFPFVWQVSAEKKSAFLSCIS